MPESYLWLLNHVGSAFTLSTKQHKFIQLHNTWNDSVTVKRLSSSSWCVWGLGHDHRVYIYVFSSDVPIRVPDTLYENQRYLPFNGFSHSCLIPTDRYAWSDEKGVKDTPKESFRLPSAHWTWEGDWMVDENLRGEVAGVEGWQYAVDFPSSHYTPEKHWNSCVRKRKWIRFRRFTSTDTWVRISDMEVVESSECFIDINVGGFYLPSQPPGFLSVWAITNSGRVYVRTSVCQDQPEGVSWQEISLGSDRGVINICVGASNLVWAVTWDGQALVRTGINRNKIYGTQWEVVEYPDDSIRFMQVAVGKNVVWALSREGKVWFRKGTCGDDIHGNISSFIGSMWVGMVGDMSCIAVSANDQVFALDANDGGVYFRTGVTSSNLTGKMWQKISLQEDISIFKSSMSETCTCSLDNTQSSAFCEYHKRRADSFTTSCSSTSTSTWIDETSSDAFLSPQSLETVPFSASKNCADQESVSEQHSSNGKDFSGILSPALADPSENQQMLDEEENWLSSTKFVHNSESIVRNDKTAEEDVSLRKATSDNFLSKADVQDQNLESNPDINPPVNDTQSSDSVEKNELQQTSGDCKIQSFVEELTEVDRFLVEREILQTHSSCSSEVPSYSPDHPNIDDQTKEVSDTALTSEKRSENENNASNKHDECNEHDENDHNSDKSLVHPKPVMTGPSKPSKHKHKSKHVKRPEHLSITESDSIVYKSPKVKKKKKKSEPKIEHHVNSDESKNEKDSLMSSYEMSSHSEIISEDQLDSPFSSIKEVQNSSQSNDSVLESTKDNVGESEMAISEQLCLNASFSSIDVNDKVTDPSITDSISQDTELTFHEHSNSLKDETQHNGVDINPDVRFEHNLEIYVDREEAASGPIETDYSDSISKEVRRPSLDSPVSDRIFDFVSFIEEDKANGDNDRVYSTPDVKTLKTSYVSQDTGNFTENETKHFHSEQSDLLKQQPSQLSSIASPDENVNKPLELPAASCMQTNPDQAQLIPLRPARKVFRYRSTPSPSISSNQGYPAFDPENLTQTRYAWRSLDVSALHVDDPSSVKWLSFKSKDFEENVPKISTSLRNDIMTKLKARNKREIYQFHNFEQAVKNTTWVKKSKMKFLRKRWGRWVACNVELEHSKSDQSNKCLTIAYTYKSNQKVKEVDLKDVICIKRSTKPDLMRTTFIIYISSDPLDPVVLQATSEADAVEWMSLLCSASATQCNLDQPIPAGSLWSCTKSGAILVSPNSPEAKSGDFCWGLHGGHMYLTETGSGGVTWGIGFDRLTYVYNGGFGGAVCTDDPRMSSNLQEMTDFHRVYVYEHQMKFPVVGWCSKGMLGNNFNWTTETGQTLASRDDVELPSSKWQWVSRWTVDFNTTGGVNSEGWQFSTVVGNFHQRGNVKDMHRRRRWVRTCRLNTQGPWMSAGSLSLLDIAIQVDPVASSNDPIVLWAIGTNGDVLCRCGVTKDNPLGQSWIHIPTDLDKPFVSITVGGGWRVWGIAGDGSTWYRSGVSQYSPAGKLWLQVVEPPPGDGILKQVSAGSTAVWAVDTEDNLWRRVNITRTFPEGTDWELVSSRVRKVSVGPKDQVWVITGFRFQNSQETSGCIYRRVGITNDKPGGTKWEKVIGEGWSHISIRGVGDLETSTK